eukprot:CAMPEP_0170199622 /NCGR_PEP_ID=MMETSP0040_2-20121228/69439_1 /TAXON_ID=641309 /ORGANISM="Lotharella oceanica, Strain CCMP622" /LENGTH=386 /DNA_ID=CAMNT_0010449761 /DNA_START=446 /DNA_END=1606 /DNA_ORIENTATION=-
MWNPKIPSRPHEPIWPPSFEKHKKSAAAAGLALGQSQHFPLRRTTVGVLFLGATFRSGLGGPMDKPCNLKSILAQKEATTSHYQNLVMPLRRLGAQVTVLFTHPICSSKRKTNRLAQAIRRWFRPTNRENAQNDAAKKAPNTNTTNTAASTTNTTNTTATTRKEASSSSSSSSRPESGSRSSSLSSSSKRNDDNEHHREPHDDGDEDEHDDDDEDDGYTVAYRLVRESGLIVDAWRLSYSFVDEYIFSKLNGQPFDYLLQARHDVYIEKPIDTWPANFSKFLFELESQDCDGGCAPMSLGNPIKKPHCALCNSDHLFWIPSRFYNSYSTHVRHRKCCHEMIQFMKEDIPESDIGFMFPRCDQLRINLTCNEVLAYRPRRQIDAEHG